MISQSTDIIPRTTLTEMCGAWKQSEQEIRQAYSLLVSAEKRLRSAFAPDSYCFNLERDEYRNYEDPDRIIKGIKKDAWRGMIDRMELRRVLSIKRAEELDKQLETGEGLPEIEEANVLAMIEQTASNIPGFIEEMVKEVFEYLRPHRSKYKTNSEFEIGPKVILTYALESSYSRNYRFRVNHWREKYIRAMDNVFHALDGVGTIKSYRGPLIDAIETSATGEGETAYFKFKGYLNHNLHLEFKRLDLLAKLNQVAGGMRLKN